MKTITLNGKKYSRTVCKNNIIKIWNQAESHNDWYQEAHYFAAALALDTRTNFNKVIGIISALSPMKKWDQNKAEAEKFLKTGEAGHFKSAVNKAKAILESDGSEEEILGILNGLKTRAFFLNIRHPENASHVTIDRHAIRIAVDENLPDGKLGIGANAYAFLQECYILAGQKLGVSPVRVQSVTWEVYRELIKK